MQKTKHSILQTDSLFYVNVKELVEYFDVHVINLRISIAARTVAIGLAYLPLVYSQVKPRQFLFARYSLAIPKYF